MIQHILNSNQNFPKLMKKLSQSITIPLLLFLPLNMINLVRKQGENMKDINKRLRWKIIKQVMRWYQPTRMILGLNIMMTMVIFIIIITSLESHNTKIPIINLVLYFKCFVYKLFNFKYSFFISTLCCECIYLKRRMYYLFLNCL